MVCPHKQTDIHNSINIYKTSNLTRQPIFSCKRSYIYPYVVMNELIDSSLAAAAM